MLIQTTLNVNLEMTNLIPNHVGSSEKEVEEKTQELELQLRIHLKEKQK